jgi:glycosyltransferase involved in cell wall biosynthesis
MKQKKIIIFMPSIERGGVEKNFFIITKFLQKKFKNISIITSDIKQIKKKNNKINIIKNHIFFKNTKSRYLKYIICLISLIKNIYNDKNIIVLSFQANLYAILICKFFGVKVIVRANASSSVWASNIYKKFIFKWIFRFADNVIVNSKDLKEEFFKKFEIKAKLIYNPLNTKEIINLSKKKSYIDDFKKKNKYLKIINIGRLTYQKDQFTFLKALNLIKQKIKFKALILGSGPDKKNLQNFIIQKKLMNFVKIINYTKNPFPVLKNADIFILTSLYEGLPNVILEALVLKKPVISTNCQTGPSEILENGKNGTLFKVRDYKSLAIHLLEFQKNKKKYLNKLKNINESLKRFDQKQNLIKYYLIVKKII